MRNTPLGGSLAISGKRFLQYAKQVLHKIRDNSARMYKNLMVDEMGKGALGGKELPNREGGG